ncbi:MAG: hypothetical protein GY749_08390 [Desulfobacteraceae bacterium]|nr:hypothetical protein [Desulfobacteraceae bacterium]
MTIAQIVSTLIAFSALIVSCITAYKTFFTKFRVELFLKSRIILTRMNGVPSIVIGCEISNLGTKSGSIDDIVLTVKYRQTDTRSINTYSFFPLLSRENYSVFETYQNYDFEPFQSIPLQAKSRLTRYIVFNPSNDSFSPSKGDMEINLFRRNSNENEWYKSSEPLHITIDENTSNTWKGPQGESVMIEAIENHKHREKLLENIF